MSTTITTQTDEALIAHLAKTLETQFQDVLTLEQVTVQFRFLYYLVYDYTAATWLALATTAFGREKEDSHPDHMHKTFADIDEMARQLYNECTEPGF